MPPNEYIQPMRFETKAIRVGQDPDPASGAVIPPIVQSATFAWESLDNPPKFDYTRVHNPVRDTLEQVVASLEGGSRAVCVSSGMAAISSVLGQLNAGDHLLMANDIYGGTHRLVHKLLPQYGVRCTEFDASDPSDIAQKAESSTRMLIFETPTNPTLRVMDIAAIASECRRLGFTSVIDNTFASPYLQNPLALGCDVVVHSTTKYLGGHSDIIGGAVVTNDDELADRAFEWAKTVGTSPSPFDCWLTLRGVKTLAVRVDRHCHNAQAVAEALERHPRVSRVHYPGLSSHPSHEVAKRQMRGFGGMMSFEVNGTAEEAKRVAESTRLFLLAESLGGVESLIGYPPAMSHAAMTEDQRIASGIPPTLIRLSIGIENVEDLIEDLAQALESTA